MDYDNYKLEVIINNENISMNFISKNSTKQRKKVNYSDEKTVLQYIKSNKILECLKYDMHYSNDIYDISSKNDEIRIIFTNAKEVISKKNNIGNTIKQTANGEIENIKDFLFHHHLRVNRYKSKQVAICLISGIMTTTLLFNGLNSPKKNSHKITPSTVTIDNNSSKKEKKDKKKSIQVVIDDYNYKAELDNYTFDYSVDEDIDRAFKYVDYFYTYGDRYGIDPILLAAIACQESRFKNIRANYDTGIMQINDSWKKDGENKLKLYNFDTKDYETITVTGDGVWDPATNIKYACAILQNCFKETYRFLYSGNDGDRFIRIALKDYNVGLPSARKIVNYGGNLADSDYPNLIIKFVPDIIKLYANIAINSTDDSIYDKFLNVNREIEVKYCDSDGKIHTFHMNYNKINESTDKRVAGKSK